MRVIRVLGKLEPGGAQLAILRLTRELERRHGVDTTLLVGDATPDGLRLAQRYGVDPVAWHVRPKLDPLRNLQWERSRRFADWLTDKVEETDLVHAHMLGAWWAVAQVLDPRTPFIASEHNEVNWTVGRVRSLRPAARRIDRFYAMGPAARQFAIDAGVRTELIMAARSPVQGLSAVACPRLGRPRLTFAGRFCHDKGPDVLIEAIALLDRHDVSCYLLGDGPLRLSLIHRAHRLGLSDRIVMPGWVERPWAYVAGAAAHVVPSREEAWSQSAVLGLGLGVPVVGTDVDGLAGTLSQSRGVTVPPDDPRALSDALCDALDGRLRIDRALAIRYARQFTASRVADFYVADYQAVLSERSHTPPDALVRIA